MSLLESNAQTLDASANNIMSAPPAPQAPGLFHNFAPSAGNYFMRSMATAGRAASMLVGAVPAIADWAIDPYSPTGEALGLQQKRLADRYFEWHDEVSGSAVDFWTPKPQEVGTAGQVVGQLAGGIVKFLASAPLAVADNQLSTSEDLVRQGVDVTTAQVAGGIAGVSTAIGIRAPAAVGGTLTQRVASGAGINVAQSALANLATQGVLRAGDAPEAAVKQFDPLDPKTLTVDVLMGAVFGAKAHFDAPPTVKDALLALNQARHLEANALPGKPATVTDVTKAVDGTRTAIDQMLRGEPVAVDGPLPRFAPDAEVDAFRAEMQALAADGQAAEPIARPEMADPDLPPPPDKPAPGGSAETAPQAPQFDAAVKLPAGDFDPATGEPRMLSANEVVAKAYDDAAQAKKIAPNLLQTAASCLLGSL